MHLVLLVYLGLDQPRCKCSIAPVACGYCTGQPMSRIQSILFRGTRGQVYPELNRRIYYSVLFSWYLWHEFLGLLAWRIRDVLNYLCWMGTYVLAWPWTSLASLGTPPPPGPGPTPSSSQSSLRHWEGLFYWVTVMTKENDDYSVTFQAKK